MEPLVVCANIVKRFDMPHSRDVVTAVNDVSLSISPGETVALVGESGSGKTTVGRLLLHTLTPSSGRLFFHGEDFTFLSERSFLAYRPRIQAVFQDPYDSLNPRLRVDELIAEPLVRMKLCPSDRAVRTRLADLIDMVALDPDLLYRLPHELSGGEQQKVGIARAIASNPEFIVLDEPMSTLDPFSRAEIIFLLRRLQQDLNIAYLFITHDLKAAEAIASRVAVMYLGKIVELANRDELFAQPTHPYTQALLSSALFPDPSRRGSVILLKGEIPSPIRLPAGCYFHSRCPIGDETCTRSQPPLDAVSNLHFAACFKAPQSHLLWQTRKGKAPGQEVGVADEPGFN